MKYVNEINKLYDELGWITISDLYHFGCLINSGFDKKIAYNLISTLNDLWLEDENGYAISKLSDMLYKVYDEIDDDMSTNEILSLMYERQYVDDSDEEMF